MSYGKIYKITNQIDGKIYIGQTTKSNVMDRFSEHVSDKRNNRYLGNAIRKYKLENFTIEIIAEALTQDELNKLEVNFVKQFNCLYPNGYNHRAGGNQNGICSDELKNKISLAKTGKPNLKRRGEPRSPEYRKKISEGLGGKPIKAINLITNEFFILQTAQEGKKYGFNPSNIVSICKKHGRRFKTKNHTFEYLDNDANQTGS